MGARTHTYLIGLSDAKLLALAPDATNQHYKGGLYRDLHALLNRKTGHVITDATGLTMRAYVHCYPHAQQAWVRPETEFIGLHEGQPRFRSLAGADIVIPAPRLDHGQIRDAETNEPFLIKGKTCRLFTENGIAWAEQE